MVRVLSHPAWGIRLLLSPVPTNSFDSHPIKGQLQRQKMIQIREQRQHCSIAKVKFENVTFPIQWVLKKSKYKIVEKCNRCLGMRINLTGKKGHNLWDLLPSEWEVICSRHLRGWFPFPGQVLGETYFSLKRCWGKGIPQFWSPDSWLDHC